MYGIGGLVFLLALSSSLAQNATHSQIVAGMDKLFEVVDINNNTFVELTELEAAWERFDADGDGRVSEAEYEQFGTDHTYRGIIFQEMDYDGDGYVGRAAIMGEYTVMDTNSDNTVSRGEFDKYYTALVENAILNYGHLLG
ncbi:probable calcium-binding protein CML26 [Mizuhopecten yessoensis]|uniref:EF-hand domain-containing protein n=1 Tax=Mizuhopecten yessoensis TaxID=6573 RepID=A0A210QMF2_MIZYE|nr:probable calcium-binding protein CML26 [Mizuhopecten yessoensis]OWF49917.1 hypothetical protein KP79_PYT04007 [Mizuhopecten yessoensis]